MGYRKFTSAFLHISKTSFLTWTILCTIAQLKLAKKMQLLHSPEYDLAFMCLLPVLFNAEINKT